MWFAPVLWFAPVVCSCLLLNRKSQDNVVNYYGKLLLNLCTTFDLCILKGVCKGDIQGCYMYISETGSSVNDYFILSNDLYALIHSTSELCVTGRIESDHMPLTLRVISPPPPKKKKKKKMRAVMKFLSMSK